jgi:hypothetical protein
MQRRRCWRCSGWALPLSAPPRYDGIIEQDRCTMTDMLAPLLVKWLTHDLATPTATVLTASELLGDKADAEINALVQDGARRLANRLRLVRAALAPGGAPIADTALAVLVRGGIDGTAIAWRRTPADLDGATAALVAGAALLLSDVRRGAPLVATDTGIEWETPGTVPPAVAATLAGAPASDARSALAALVLAAADRAGIALRINDNGLAWG